MGLIGTPARDITEAVLRRLIDAQVPEGKTIDYKAELPGGSDSSRKDFLADLCSFANVEGGHLIYAMEESAGLPTKLTGLMVDVDQAILRLESMARDGIRPPIMGLEFVRVPLASGGTAIVCAIPKSWNPPHQVIFQKDYRFYTRGSAGKQHFDVEELRRVILFSQVIGERIRHFRAARISAVMSGDTPVALQPGARQILHFVPLASFAAGMAADLRRVAADPGKLVGLMDRGGSTRPNVDGLLAYSSADKGHHAYAQLYRNGVIEVTGLWDGGQSKRKLPSLAFEKDVFAKTRAALALLSLAGITPPVVMLLSFTGIKGWEMAVRDDWATRGGRGGFDRDPLLIPELVLQSLEASDIRTLVLPLIETTWQAAGFEGSDYYDQNGNWIGERPR